MLKRIVTFPILPLVYIFDAVKLKNTRYKSIILNLIKIVFAIFVLAPLWTTLYFLFFLIIMRSMGYIEEQIPISGTGSMYPTFPKGLKTNPKDQAKEIAATPKMYPYPNGIIVFNKRYLNYHLKRNDIVEFDNVLTNEITEKLNGEGTGMVKRIIGMPGETIEIRDGLVLVNDSPLIEPFVARSRSTFGGSYLQECNKLKIPDSKLFVMGDNRKGSGDSRFDLGLIDFKDIHYVLPYEKQIGLYNKYWHNTENDLKETAKIRINTNEYLKLLNKKRSQAGVKTLRIEPKLIESAKIRGKIILENNDFSFEATKSGQTMKRAIEEVGYSNIIWAEAPVSGYYDAAELIENQFELPDYKKFLLNPDYEDFGLDAVEGEINGCPSQVIVQHFAGYLPPNYKKDDIDKLKKLMGKITEIQPSWSNLKNYPDFYEKNKKDIDRLNEIIAIRISKIKEIAEKMDANLWLTDKEENYLNQEDQKLNDEQNTLASKLNNL